MFKELSLLAFIFRPYSISKKIILSHVFSLVMGLLVSIKDCYLSAPIRSFRSLTIVLSSSLCLIMIIKLQGVRIRII